MTNEEIDKLLKGELKENEVIEFLVRDGDFIYISTPTIDQVNNPDDDRYKTVGGKGPIKINLLTKEFERIHYLYFPSHLLTEPVLPKLSEIKEGIRKRKYLNENDVYNFVSNIRGEDFDKVFYRFEAYDEDHIRVSFRIKDIQQKFECFLNENNLNFIKEKEDEGLELLMVYRYPR
ncbi:hypothetical protein [Aquimarina sp. 2201CG5-10]|uniref:hypothetical protein n=1 Tax=Aquimarina callyspongiae TaxID=3098150 RepID=UPI002AB4486D|nr:hypothetical protein [Aquimarina sp. 2201CG5-10]MDY8138490.1 hypothetical protein [Aquimarina sp. 2201CG5-10]